MLLSFWLNICFILWRTKTAPKEKTARDSFRLSKFSNHHSLSFFFFFRISISQVGREREREVYSCFLISTPPFYIFKFSPILVLNHHSRFSISPKTYLSYNSFSEPKSHKKSSLNQNTTHSNWFQDPDQLQFFQQSSLDRPQPKLFCAKLRNLFIIQQRTAHTVKFC